MASEEGDIFVKRFAAFVRTHEKSLANALQAQQTSSVESLNRQSIKVVNQNATQNSILSVACSAGMSTLAAAFSLSAAGSSYISKPAKLTLTPHHLFYLLSCFENLGIDVGPMNVRLESIHIETTPSNYVSFLSYNPKLGTTATIGKDSDSIHSVSSMRSVMSNMSTFWSSLGHDRDPRSAKAKAAVEAEIKYLYSAFTKIPCLRLSRDHRAQKVRGYEEFPFDTAVPLIAFKNVSSLEIYDLDFRQLYGWDKISEQLRSLTIKRGNVQCLKDLLTSVVIDDSERRRRRPSKFQTPSTPLWSLSPRTRHSESSFGSSPGCSSAGCSISRHNLSYYD